MIVHRMSAAIKQKRNELKLLHDRTLDQYLEEIQPSHDDARHLKLKYKPGRSILEALAQIENRKEMHVAHQSNEHVRQVIEIFWKAHEQRTAAENKTLIEFMSRLPLFSKELDVTSIGELSESITQIEISKGQHITK